MIRISTDRNGATDRLAGPTARSFRRAIAATVSALIVLVAIFAGLNYLQGPKLSSAQVDAARAVAQSGQQLRLFANQSITTVTKAQVAISPSVPFTVSSSGEVIAVQFGTRLDYGTRYAVQVRQVGNGSQPRTSTFDYSFSTAGAQFYFLQRAALPAAGAPVGTDSIMRTGMSGSARTIVYSAAHIQQYAIFPRALAVSTLASDGTSSLSLISLDNGFVQPLPLPGPGTVDQLTGAAQAGVLAFVFTSSGAGPQYRNALMTIDLLGADVATPVLEGSGQPLDVSSYTFITNSSRIAARAADGTVSLVDTAKVVTAPTSAAVAIGRYTSLGRSSPDGLSIVLGDVSGEFAYSLANGAKTRLPASSKAGAATSGGDLVLTGSGTARVQQVTAADGQDLLVYQDGAIDRVLLQTKDGAGSIEGFSVSPNGQYVAVNVIPNSASSMSDGYAVDPQSITVSTVFIDIASGAVVRSVAGFDESW